MLGQDLGIRRKGKELVQGPELKKTAKEQKVVLLVATMAFEDQELVQV